MQESAIVRVPAARISFPDDDRQAILEDIDGVLRSGTLTLGPHGAALERDFAAMVGARHAVGVSSGTSALEIALRILGVEGRDVVVPTNTFFATAAAVVHAGGRPRLADVEPGTLTASAETIRQALTPDTAGVIVVHIGGAVAPETPKIADLCRDRGVFLLEDAAHAHGSTLAGRMAGTFGVAAAFSFYPTKVMTAAEGGMLVTDDDAMQGRARQYRDQGKAGFHTNLHVCMGYNWRLSEVHAVIGRRQLARLDEVIADRRRIATAYSRALRELRGLVPLVAPGSESNYYKYPVLLEAGVDRTRLKTMLRDRHGVALSGEVYETPCHRQPALAPWADTALPAADEMCARHMCLPVYTGMTDAEIAHVVAALGQTLADGRSRCASP